MKRALHTIEIRTNEYRLSHGHAPRGRGSWLFEFIRDRQVEGPWGWDLGSRTYSEALGAAKKHAQVLRADAINVCP